MAKSVVITGANGGMGRAFVRAFAMEGYTVIPCARQETEQFSEYLHEISEQFRVDVYPCYFDVVDTAVMKSEIMRVMKLVDSVDVLVNNVGMAHTGLLTMTKIETVRKVFDVNYFSYLELTQIILKKMMRQKSGCIINMSSIAADDMKAGNSAYGASKAAVKAWTKSLAAEVAQFGVRVNALAPGMIDTSMASTWNIEDAIAMSDMKRMATPDEIANVAVYLVSDKASFVNGQTIRINGGGKPSKHFCKGYYLAYYSDFKGEISKKFLHSTCVFYPDFVLTPPFVFTKRMLMGGT